MNFRLAKPEELTTIIAIEQTCFPPAEAASAEEFRKRFEAFPENFIVALEEEKIIGFINGGTTDKPELPDALYHDTTLHNPYGAFQTVFGLDVLPSYRNQGVAAHLLNHLIMLSKERGKTGMVLTCKDHLIGYYQRFGFQHQGVSISSHGGSKWNDMVLYF